jgi:hypothetical protein
VAAYILKSPVDAFVETSALLDAFWRVVEFPS